MDRDWLLQYKHLEWEGLQEAWVIDQIAEAGDIPIGSERIKLWRDDQYRVRGELAGTYLDHSELDFHVQPGTLAQSLVIEGMGKEGYRYSLCKGYLRAHNALHSLKEGVAHTFTSRLEHFEVTRSFAFHESAPAVRWLTEWYLNGIRFSGVFWQTTERELAPQYTKARDTTLFKAPEREARSSSADHAFIEYDGKGFIVQQVPAAIGPSWSKNIGIEYRPEWGGIPEREERIAIAEIVGFVLGRRLLNVGFTEYDELGDPITEMVTSPPTSNVVEMCQANGPTPINIEPHVIGGQKIETILQILVPAYLRLRGPLHLSDGLWRYNLARDLPIGIDLPVLAAAIEGVGAAWFEDHTVPRYYLDADRYAGLLKEDFARIEAKLQAAGVPGDNISKMMNKLYGAYSTGGNESLYLFFDQVGLTVSKFEKGAIRARNPMAHGAPAMPHYLEKASKLRRAYETLFVRLLLKILKYDGPYIDYSSIGCPPRHIDEPQQGD